MEAQHFGNKKRCKMEAAKNFGDSPGHIKEIASRDFCDFK